MWVRLPDFLKKTPFLLALLLLALLLFYVLPELIGRLWLMGAQEQKIYYEPLDQPLRVESTTMTAARAGAPPHSAKPARGCG